MVMIAERLTDVEYEREPTYGDVQMLIALLNGNYGAPIKATAYRGLQAALYAQSDDVIADFLGVDDVSRWLVEETGLTGSAPTSLTDTLDVAGATTLAELTAGASTLLSAAITNNATVGGTLGVTGNTALGGTLGVTGATTLAALTAGASTLLSAAITNNATVGGTLGVTGATTLAALTAASLAVTGNVAVNTNKLVVTASTGDLETAGNLNVANTKGLYGRDTGNTLRNLISLTNANVVYIGQNTGVTIQFANADIGFFGVTPVGRQSIGSSASGAAAVETLVNNIRSALINLGLAQT